MSDPIITLHIKRSDLLKLGMVYCGSCGYPPNNHFLDQPGKPCAHSDKCKGYDEKFRYAIDHEPELPIINDLLPNAFELSLWDKDEKAGAVKAYRNRINCGLREAIDAFKAAGRRLGSD